MNDSIKEDLTFIKNELESLNIKVDLILDMLNSFTIMLTESDEETDLDSIYDSEDNWISEKNEDWNSYQDDDDDED